MLDTMLLSEDPGTDVPPASHLLIAVDDTAAGRRTLISGLAQAAVSSTAIRRCDAGGTSVPGSSESSIVSSICVLPQCEA